MDEARQSFSGETVRETFRPSPLARYDAILADARGVLWHPRGPRRGVGVKRYAVAFNGTENCWIGGRIVGNGESGRTAPSAMAVGTAYRTSNTAVHLLTIRNALNGLWVGREALDPTIENVLLSQLRNTCVIAEHAGNLVVDNVYFHKCARVVKLKSQSAGSTLTIRNSVIRINNARKVRAQGRLFDGAALRSQAQVVFENNIVATTAALDELSLAVVETNCSNNTLIWLGRGHYPGDLPGCFTVVEDRAAWREARIAWRNQHRQRLAELDEDSGNEGSDDPVAWVTHADPVADTTLRRPSYNATNPLSAGFIDQRFNTRIVRVTGDPGQRILLNGSSSSGRTWPRDTCHQYSSNDNAWNVDGSLLVLNGCDNRYGMLLDGNTFKVLRVGLDSGGLPFWSRSDPDMMYAIGGNAVREYFPRTNRSRSLMTLSGYSELKLDGHGQNTSDDGTWVAVTAMRQRDRRKVMFGINLATRRKGPDIVAPSNLNQGENVFISATGRYLIAALGYGGKDQNIYEVDTGRLVNTYRGDIITKHPDTYQLDGRDYWVFVASGGGIGGRVVRRDILTNREYMYMDIGVANHVSTRNLRDPRWAIVTYDSGRNPFPHEIVAIRIDGDHRNVIRRLAKHNSERQRYDNEPHPNPSPDGKKIVFASNWGDGPTNTYVILLPDWDTPALGREASGPAGQS